MRGYPLLFAVVLLAVAALYLGNQYRKPIPPLEVTTALAGASTPLPAGPALPWPKNGAAAVAVDRLGVVASVRDEKPRPIASVTKIMTGYLILKNHPLKPGDKGPTVRVTAADVRAYNDLVAGDYSVVPVSEGAMFSQYELLQGLLVPSGNNFAQMLAAWDAGSVAGFVEKMNAEAAALGLRDTRYADPAGVSAGSTSTARDQLVLAQAAMANPVFAEIVAKPQVTLTGAGVLFNVNALLGQDGIVGVKTGWTEEAGGCFVFAAKAQVEGRAVTIYGAVLGQDTRKDAFDVSKTLVQQLGAVPRFAKVFSEDTLVAQIDSDWGQRTDVTATAGAELLLWPGMEVQTQVLLNGTKTPIAGGDELGSVVITAGDQRLEVPVKATSAVAGPTRLWRFTR